MELRCHHCGRVFEPVAGAREARCPGCGVTLLVHREGQPVGGTHHAHSHPIPRREMRRIFTPVPNVFLYLVGLLIVLGILAPFWLAEVGGQFGRKQIIISDETPDTTPAWSHTKPLAASSSTDEETPTTPLDQFEGIHLNAPRESLEHRFTLYLKNTRGMLPEIYEARDARGIDRLTAHFYNNELKEFIVVLPPKLITPDELLRSLRVQYGEPNDWSKGEETPVAGIGGALVSDLEPKRYAEFGQYRRFSWYNDNDRLEATIYFTTTDPVTCESLVIIHVSAKSWLDAYRPVAIPVAAEPTNAPPVATGTTGIPRLFP
jgi:DNA-directed RNA polymerase subunit RPC12/RpoP